MRIGAWILNLMPVKKCVNLGCAAPRRSSTRTVGGPPLLDGHRPGGAVRDRFLRGGQILFGEFWLQGLRLTVVADLEHCRSGHLTQTDAGAPRPVDCRLHGFPRSVASDLRRGN